MRRALRSIAIATGLGVLALSGILIYGVVDPAFVYRDVSIHIPVAPDQVLNDALALKLGGQAIDEAGLSGKMIPYHDDRLENGNKYLYVSDSGRGTLMYQSHENGTRFLHIELADGVAHCELWRGK